MIRTFLTFLKEDLSPRWKSVVCGSEFFFAIAAGITISQFAQRAAWAPTVQAHVFATAILTYASIALGFSIAGASVALALPEKFVRVLHDSFDESGNRMFGNLIFVYAWTAAIHVILAIVAVFGFFIFDPAEHLLTKVLSWRNDYAGVLVGVSVYCVIQFLITIAVICSVGRVYANHLNEAVD